MSRRKFCTLRQYCLMVSSSWCPNPYYNREIVKKYCDDAVCVCPFCDYRAGNARDLFWHMDHHVYDHAIADIFDGTVPAAIQRRCVVCDGPIVAESDIKRAPGRAKTFRAIVAWFWHILTLPEEPKKHHAISLIMRGLVQ